METDDNLSRMFSDLAEMRMRLDAALRVSQHERGLLHGSFADLAETMLSVRKSARTRSSAGNNGSSEPGAEKLDSLTGREEDVLRLIIEGLSTKEIAFRLNISFKTAVSHRTRLLKKVGVHESASLVRIALHSGFDSSGGG